MLCTLRWQGLFNWVKYFLDPDNPFLSWILVTNLLLLALHLYIVYWTYKDALRRYHRGAPWAVLVALLPLVGWVFYLLYRVSPLVELDRIELETFEEAEFEWTDYDQYKANRHAAMFASVKSLLRREEGSGYNDWIRRSRERELKRKLSPEEVKQRKAERIAARAQRRIQKQQYKQEVIALRKQRVIDKRERQTMTGAHGFQYRLSERKQRSLRRHMEVVEQLKQMPREVTELEDMIYEMRYREALQAAQDGLTVAQEMNDPQGVVTFEAYINRLIDIMSREEADHS